MTVVIAGAAFADHPNDKLGIGVMGGFLGQWDESGLGHISLSLKLPGIPVFWGGHLGFNSSYFRLGVFGDYYIIESPLVSNINLHWYVGLGGWLNLGFNEFYLSFGARLPIGISWHVIDMLEVFLEAAPSLGIKVAKDFHFPAGGWPLALGIRVWL